MGDALIGLGEGDDDGGEEGVDGEQAGAEGSMAVGGTLRGCTAGEKTTTGRLMAFV